MLARPRVPVGKLQVRTQTKCATEEIASGVKYAFSCQAYGQEDTMYYWAHSYDQWQNIKEIKYISTRHKFLTRNTRKGAVQIRDRILSYCILFPCLFSRV